MPASGIFSVFLKIMDITASKGAMMALMG